jgi:hypothetical protein
MRTRAWATSTGCATETSWCARVAGSSAGAIASRCAAILTSVNTVRGIGFVPRGGIVIVTVRVRPGALVGVLTVAGALVAGIILSVQSATPASAATHSVVTHVPKGVIVNGRFIKSYALADGALTVTPAATAMTPTRKETVVATQVWAITAVQGYNAEGLGLGIVTITKIAKGVPTVKKLAAWVGLANDYGLATSCPIWTVRQKFSKLPPLPSAGWVVVVVGDARNSPAVAYRAASARCGYLNKASLVNATEQISVPWTTDTAHPNSTNIFVHLAYCADYDGRSSSGSPTETTGSVYAALVEDPAAMPKAPTLGHCTPAHTLTLSAPFLARSGPTKIVHGPLGPVRQAR